MAKRYLNKTFSVHTWILFIFYIISEQTYKRIGSVSFLKRLCRMYIKD